MRAQFLRYRPRRSGPRWRLYLPQAVPVLSADELAAMRPMHYRDLAYAIISRFATDIPPDDFERPPRRASAEAFGAEGTSRPLVPLERAFPS